MATKKSAASEGSSFLSKLLEPPKDTEYMETGNIGFDMVISNGKGLPLGSSILLWAEPGVGKTTLFVDLAKRLIYKNKAEGKTFKVLYIDVEGGALSLIEGSGLYPALKSRDLIYYSGQVTWKNVESACEAILSGHKDLQDVKLIIIDSVGQILSEQNVKKSITDGDYGTRAKERGNFYSKFFPLLKARGISTFLVGQARQNQEAQSQFDPKTKAAASWGDQHTVDIILKCSAKNTEKFDSKRDVETASGKIKEIVYYVMKLDPTARNCKARTGLVRPNEILIQKGVGAQNFFIVFNMLELHEYIKLAGTWYSMDKELSALLEEKEGKKYRANDIKDILLKKGAIAKVVSFLKERGDYRVTKNPEETLASSVLENEEHEEEEQETVEV